MTALHWTAKTTPNANFDGIIGMVPGRGEVFAMWTDGSFNINLSVSNDDGATWTPSTVNTPAGIPLLFCPHNTGGSGARYLFLSNAGPVDGTLWGSTDNGVTWNPIAGMNVGWANVAGSYIPAGIGTDQFGNVLVTNSVSDDVSISSDGGATWTPHIGVTGGALAGFNAGSEIVWDGAQWVTTGVDGGGATFVATSPDGVTWTLSATAPNQLFVVRFANGQYAFNDTSSNLYFGATVAAAIAATGVFPTGITTLGDFNFDGANWVASDASTTQTAYSADGGVTWQAGDPYPFSGDSALLAPGGGGVFGFGLTLGNLALSSFVSNATVPDLIGLSNSDATAALTAANLTNGSVTSAFTTSQPVGLVFLQSIAAGATVPAGTPVGYTLSLGPQGIVVPDVVGLTAAAAEAALIVAGLNTGAITGVNNSPIPVGDVATQDPIAGTIVTAGSLVALGVSFVVPQFDIDATVISQYANSPTIVQLVEDFGEWFDPSANIQSFYLDVWNIDTAEGFGLDIWGIILGVSRVVPVPGTAQSFGFDTSDSPPDWENFGNQDNPTVGGPFFSGQIIGNSFKLLDGPYRTLLLTKALANICSTTAPGLNALITNLFPGRGRCYTQDRGMMEMSYVFEFPLTTIERAILNFSGVLAHPAGVGFNIIVIDTTYFGFNEMGIGAEPLGFGLLYNGG